jgi:hypothetical protein
MNAIRTKDDRPIPTGVQMVSTLSVYNKLSFLTKEPKEVAQQWLDLNKIVDVDDVIDRSVALAGEVIVERQIKVARTRGPVDLVITASPKTWVFAFEQGIPAVLFGTPEYSRVEFRPDAPKKVRSWDDIVAAVDKQNELRTQDARLARTDSINFGVTD